MEFQGLSGGPTEIQGLPYSSREFQRNSKGPKEMQEVPNGFNLYDKKQIKVKNNNSFLI